MVGLAAVLVVFSNCARAETSSAKVADGLLTSTFSSSTPRPVQLIAQNAVAPKGAGSKLPAKTPSTQHEIIPIFLQHCAPCHGAQQREGGLDLRTKASMLRGGKSGPALILGKPDESLLVRRIQSQECPPSKRLVEASVKPVAASALAKVIEWIASGAPEASEEPDLAGTPQDPLVHDKDRDFWSFRPPQAVLPPLVRQPALVRNPIDAFVLSKLEAKGLSFALEASESDLLRRVHFDLTGLPPSPEETEAFLADTDPQAYEKMVDRLLASPRYGERWGRYWLDVAGYADAEGRREQHLPRLFAYRYRDYVIRAFNTDKPYDRFLTEQIAGDELADYEHAPSITQEIYDNLVATGFLRMGPDPTWANSTGFVPDRLDVVADAIDILGSGVMGLTFKCARCHDHKFDPIPQRDYYRLVDLFKGAFDEYDWLKPDLRSFGGAANIGKIGERSLPFVLPEERQAWEKHNQELQVEIDARNTELREEETRLKERFRDAQLAALSERLRDDVLKMLTTPAANRTAAQVQFAEQYEKKLAPDRNELKKFDAAFKKHCEEIDSLQGKKRPEPRIAALWDRGEPSPTYIYRRGDFQRTGSLVKGGVPAVLCDGRASFELRPPWPEARKTGRRLALARWLTRPDNPVTTRVMVNRIWKNHFGQGIVKSLGNFGKMGARPTNPELLDWLSNEFVRQGWRMKPLHRLILTSRAFRQSSIVSSEQIAADPENVLLSRMPLRRLEAEALWDSCLLVAGCLDETPFGPPVPVQVRGDGLVTAGQSGNAWRRSIYGQQLRKEVPTLLELFDLPQMNPNCIERGDSIVAPQALHLMNDSVLRALATRFAQRVRREAGLVRERQVQRAYVIAFARSPSESETQLGVEVLRKISAAGADHRTGETIASAKTGNETPSEDGTALSTFCHALMNSAEFLYID
ncbi:MAG: PSD1 and planctomycete cytochrome C domain-containing protein [Verrucomicrobiota bacterium]